MNTKDVYAGMAPSSYVRQLGSVRQAPMVKRRKRRALRRAGLVRTQKINEAFAYLEAKHDPALAEMWDIYRYSVKEAQQAWGDEACAMCQVDIKHVYDTIDDDGIDLVVCLSCKAEHEGHEAKLGRRRRGWDDHDSSTHPDIPNKPGDNWISRRGQHLPSYVHRVARHIHADSAYSWDHAIASAINVMKRRAAQGNAAAAASLARWEALKATAGGGRRKG